MWAGFIIGCLVGILILFIPGALVLRALRFSLPQSCAFAPALSVAIIAIAGVAIDLLSLKGVGALLGMTALITVALSAKGLLSSLTAWRAHAAEKPSAAPLLPSISWEAIALYVVVNVGVMGYLFLICLSSLDAIIPIGDVNYHVNVVMSMMDSGNFSTLSVSPYPDSLPAEEVPFAANGYYPAAWHAVCALLGSLCGLSAPLAENVLNFLFTSVVFPLGVLGLLTVAFPERKTFVWWGALVVCAGVAFPLRPLLVHQIYPNIAGFSCLPAVIALSAAALGPLDGKGMRSRLLAASFGGFVGLGLLHPNVFLAGCVFLFAIVLCIGIPQLSACLARRARQQRWRSPRRWRIALSVAWIVLAVTVWLVLLDLPAFASITNFLWTWTVSVPKAIMLVLSFGLCLGPPQYLLALLGVIGAIWCSRHEGHGWLVLAAVLFAIVFCGGAAGSPEVKKVFAGFWYTDPERTSALFTIAMIPLVAAGLGLAYQGVRKGIDVLIERGEKASSQQGRTATAARSAKIGAIAVVTAVFVSLDFFAAHIPLPLPGFGDGSGFAITRQALRYESDPANSPLYTEAEQRFVDEALALVSQEGHDDALIINQPHDGSLFAYPVNDANVYYKSYIRSGQESEESKAIRLSLDEISTDEAVRAAVRKAEESAGAVYVLVLNHDEGENYDSNRWKEEDWTGFDDLTDATPGFETVLADGTMRLYRITALD